MTLDFADIDLDFDMETTVSAGQDDVRQYLNEIRRFPRLTAEEERHLAKRCADGDVEAIRQMVSSNLRLVVSTSPSAHRFARCRSSSAVRRGKRRISLRY